MVLLNDLINAELCTVEFGKDHYFISFVKGEIKYQLSTSYYMNSCLSAFKANSDIGADVSRALWEFIGKLVLEIKKDRNTNSIRLIFNDGEIIYFWQEQDAFDNLLILKDLDSGNWCTVDVDD